MVLIGAKKLHVYSRIRQGVEFGNPRPGYVANLHSATFRHYISANGQRALQALYRTGPGSKPECQQPPSDLGYGVEWLGGPTAVLHGFAPRHSQRQRLGRVAAARASP